MVAQRAPAVHRRDGPHAAVGIPGAYVILGPFIDGTDPLMAVPRRPDGRPRAGRSPRSRRPKQNFETWSWFFMRVSGLVLIFLALTHFAITHIVNDVVETDAAFVGRALGQPAVAALRLGAARPRPGPRPQRAALDHRRLHPQPTGPGRGQGGALHRLRRAVRLRHVHHRRLPVGSAVSHEPTARTSCGTAVRGREQSRGGTVNQPGTPEGTGDAGRGARDRRER